MKKSKLIRGFEGQAKRQRLLAEEIRTLPREDVQHNNKLRELDAVTNKKINDEFTAMENDELVNEVINF